MSLMKPCAGRRKQTLPPVFSVSSKVRRADSFLVHALNEVGQQMNVVEVRCDGNNHCFMLNIGKRNDKRTRDDLKRRVRIVPALDKDMSQV